MKLIRGQKADPKGYAEQEEILLAGYYAEQGIETTQGGIQDDNLDRYGSGGLSTSNPLFSSARNSQAQVKDTPDTFQETLQEKVA